MDFSLTIPAFVAGVLTFFAPCTLPLVPAYLLFISGVSLNNVHDVSMRARRKIFFTGVLFVAGFSLVFIVFGTLAGFLGAALVPYRSWIARIGGSLVILSGLFMLGFVQIPLLNRRRLNIYALVARGRALGAFMLGMAFSAGWTQCVGPILGSILLLASTSATAFQGAALLAVFSLGLAAPFLAVALAIGSATKLLARISRYSTALSRVGGVFLIVIGLLLLTDNMALLVSHGYRLFKFINYDRLLDYL
jgi:cytochrome c-type biogenesis protein